MVEHARVFAKTQGLTPRHAMSTILDKSTGSMTQETTMAGAEAEIEAGPKGGGPAYDADSIQVLEGLEAVRKRPGMYIGNTDDGSGLHHMVYEVVDNSVDEALAGHCDRVTVTIEDDVTVSVQDNGRGIPVGVHKKEGRSAAEVILTVLHAGGKFDQNSYKVSGGLHGVGVSVVNFLSEYLRIEVRREGHLWMQEYERGKPKAPLVAVGPAKSTGTKITFRADPQIFMDPKYSFDILSQRLRELSYLNSGVAITVIDERDGRRHDFKFEGGISSFVEGLNKNREPLHPEPVYIIKEVPEAGVTVEVAMQWNDSYQENIFCYTNNIRNRDGGTHLSGLKGALTRTLNAYSQAGGLTKSALTGDDVREGLTAVLSVKMPDPKFSSQTKDKLVSNEIKGYVESVMNENLAAFLEENPGVGRQIVNKAVSAQRARDAARKAREIARKSALGGMSSLPGKLADCQSKSPEESEIYIVEGDSAGGSAKQGRDRKFQAILPLRGKILNVEKARFDRMLASNEITTLISALGCGIGQEHFDIEKLRYHRVILMTDADVDGSHIRTLLLTFFYRQMPEVIERGYLYIAQPPLYGVKRGKSMRYLKDETELNAYLIENAVKAVTLRGAQGLEVQGEALRPYIEHLIGYSDALKKLARRKDPQILSLAAQAGFGEEMLGDEEALMELGNTILERLGQIDDSAQWSAPVVRPDEMVEDLFEMQWSTRVMGVLTQTYLDRRVARSPEYRTMTEALRAFEDFGGEVRFEANTVEATTTSLEPLLEQVLLAGRKGQTIQRYKGLGEMNPEQLWETTMDPEVRTFLQVHVEDAVGADELFTILMGDQVEPRREFIEHNALDVRNLDV